MTFEARRIDGGGQVLVPADLEDAGFLAVFTERTGGVSHGAFASLNLSYSTEDAPTSVAENRARLVASLGIPTFALGGQVHGDHLEEVGPAGAGRGFDGSDGVLSGTDGLFTTVRDLPIAVATADCVPVILAAPDTGMISVVHAGWRGTAAGIIDRALDRFAEHGDLTDVRVAIGPAAGACCYEVGPEVLEAVAVASSQGLVSEERDGRAYLDLAATIVGIAGARGTTQIELAGLCTIHQTIEGASEERPTESDLHPDDLVYRFFSHRRQGPCGRQFAIGMRR